MTARATSRPVILYIEDDPLCAELVQSALAQDYDVRWTRNEMDGLEKTRAQRPALVLVDLHLSTLSGFEVIERLRSSKETAHIPVLVLSARVMREERTRAAALGTCGFIEKPFSLSTLRQVVTDCISASRDTPVGSSTTSSPA